MGARKKSQQWIIIFQRLCTFQRDKLLNFLSKVVLDMPFCCYLLVLATTHVVGYRKIKDNAKKWFWGSFTLVLKFSRNTLIGIYICNLKKKNYSPMCIIPDTWCCCCIFGGWPNMFCPKRQIKKPRITGFWIKIIGDLSNTPARIPLNEILHLIYDPRHNVFMWFVFYVIVSGSVTIPPFLYIREKKKIFNLKKISTTYLEIIWKSKLRLGIS